MSRLYRDDIGARIVVETANTGMPITTVLQLHVTKPGGGFETWSGTTLSVDFNTGIITYTTIAGDLDETGEYKVQVHGVFDDGTDEVSDIDSFTVYDKLS